jgi:hypothetical protein
MVPSTSFSSAFHGFQALSLDPCIDLSWSQDLWCGHQ